MGELVRGDATTIMAELDALGLMEGPPPPDFALWHHFDRDLTVTYSIERYDLEQANAFHFGITRWRHAGVGVRGQLQARLADQRAIGRKREPGERSTAPLPDWYDLTHLVYEHPELGFNPEFPVFQVFPPKWAPYLNVAEVLHLRQPI